MPLTPQELKDKLLRTLDKDYNVVDIAGAKEALSILEKYPITRETLEQTRLGRYVNEMRKKTSDRDFAKRIKNLVRRWQVLVTPGTPATPATITADQPPISEPPPRVNGKAPVNARLLDGHVKGGLIPGLRPASPASRPQTPCSARSSVSSPQSTHGAPPPPVTAVSAVRRDVTDARDTSTTLSRCASSPSEVPLSSSRTSVVSPLVGHTTIVSQHRAPNSKQLHSAPTTPLNSTNLVGGQLTTTVNHVVTSGKRKRTDEPLPGIRIKIMKKSGSSAAMATTTESETLLKDRVSSSTTSASTWSCTAETTSAARKPPNANGMLAAGVSLPDTASTPPSSTSNVVPPTNTPTVKSRRGRPPNSSARHQGAITTPLDRVTSTVTTTPITTTSTLTQSETPTLTRPDTPSGAASASLPTFIPKVATTAELIEKLHRSGDLRLTASETVRKIASNQIVKETMSENDSVVPASAKPRQRKKNSVAMPPSTPDNVTMFQIKNEMVHKFLESSVSPNSSSTAAASLHPTATNHSLMNLLKRLDPPPDPDSPLFGPNDYHHSTSKLSRPHSTSPNRTASPNDALEPWHSLPPPLDPTQIDWSTTEYVAPDPESRPPVTDDDVERLHASQWSGVNGQYDFRNEWSDWTDTYSATSYGGDLLHILPYVNIRD